MPDQIPSKNALVLDEPELLNALIGAIWTLKFDTSPEDGYEFAGSPQIAEIVNRACDCLIALYREQGRNGSANELVDWRKLENSTVQLSVLPAYIRLIQRYWDAWSEGQRIAYIRLFMAPTIVSDAEASTFLSSLDDQNKST